MLDNELHADCELWVLNGGGTAGDLQEGLLMDDDEDKLLLVETTDDDSLSDMPGPSTARHRPVNLVALNSQQNRLPPAGTVVLK